MADSIASLFRAGDPGRVAVHFLRSQSKGGFRDEQITLGDWVRGADACAAALEARGLRRGQRVLLCLPTGRAFLDAFLGAISIGVVPVPLPSLEGFARPAAFVNRLTSVVQDAAPSAVFADPRTAAHLRRAGLLGADLPVIEPMPPRAGSAPVPRPPEGDEVALIQYTSGSTGTPRGVVITAANLAANIEAMGKALRLTSADRVVSWLPLYHDMGLIGGLLAPAAHGATCSLLSPLEFMLHPASWMRAASQARATLTVAPNFAYGLVARKVADEDLRGLDLSSLRAAINGAEPVDVATAEAFCARLAPMGFSPRSYFPVYGLAESTLSVAFPPLGRGLKVDHVRRDELAKGRAVTAEPGPGTMRIVSVGRALEGHSISIVEAVDHAPLPERRLGEIWVQGPSISPWYFDKHEPVRSRRHSLRTQDVGYLADGELYVVDRLKDLVIVAGRSYSPSDIERAAEGVEGVRAGRSVAFGVADEDRATEALILVAEVQPRSRAELRRLSDAVRERVTDQIGLSPADVRLLKPGALARTSSGKLMRRDARDRYLHGGLDGGQALRPFFPQRILDAARATVMRFLARRLAQR
ncbi:MAG: fatty acyl-AMP ligase [Deltaproteobacteria bacterium]|nr:MAG: fatty acyl-AMP ligase [Deltaproteobacteria bacterium]